MPNPKARTGAAIIPINVTAPAMRGLNTEAGASLLSPEWATVLNNAVFDGAGRASARLGWGSQTSTPVAGVVMRVHEYLKADGTVKTILSTDADVFQGAAAPASIEGALTVTNGNIKFCNFNDKCIALGIGAAGIPAVYTGAGNFASITVASGTAPTSGIGTSAFGRLWVVDVDGKTIHYSALLDETKWDTADAGGEIDMSKVWPSGQDQVIAIEEFAGDLVIFGKNNIVMWTDGQGSDLGINPAYMYISDTIPGVGCTSQFAIARAKGDLWFLSPTGMQSLARALQDKTTPTNNVSRNVQSNLLAYSAAENDKDDVTLVYSAKEDFVLCIFPQSNKVMCFDTRGMMEDQTYRVTEWSTTLQTATYFQSDLNLYGSLTGTVGEIMKYTGYNDDGTNYDFSFATGWLDFGESNQYLKFVKRLTSFMFVGSSTTINFTLQYDFSTAPESITAEAAGAVGAVFGDDTAYGSSADAEGSEFTGSDTSAAYIGYIDDDGLVLNETEFGGGIALQTMVVPGQGSGQYIKVGCNLGTTDGTFALQSINLFAKLGRIA
jgi:hypothetical protein